MSQRVNVNDNSKEISGINFIVSFHIFNKYSWDYKKNKNILYFWKQKIRQKLLII